MRVYPCPKCGKSTGRKGRPFSDPSQTCAHIDGAHDEPHRGERGEDYREQIEENGVALDDVEEPEPVDNSSESSSDPLEREVETFAPSPDGDVETVSVPVRDAVSGHSAALAQPDEFGLAGADRVGELEAELDRATERVDVLTDRIEELRESVELLAEASPGEFEADWDE